MRKRPLVLLLCLLCLAGAWFFWPRENGRDGSPSRPHEAVAPAVQPHPPSAASKILTPVYVNSAKPGTVLASTNPFAFRLSNTTKPLDQLVNNSHAILLENALIDASQPLNFSIPTHLQSQGDPGAYIVQAHGPIDAAFRAMLAAAGAEIVSYIPNNAYLVRAQAGVANGLADNPLTQAVTPYEPYYKIQSSLLTLAIGQMDLSDDMVLTLGLFTTTAAQTIQEIEKLGGKVLTQENTPVGTIVKVVPPKDWTALATLPGTKNVELSRQRVPANDLSRVAVGVSTDARTTANYMDLSGQKVLVEVNDFGIDAAHLDLVGRIFGDPANLVDTNGHGTHVAGIIAGNGSQSLTVTNARGSIMPATDFQFRGMAPKATLLSMLVGYSSSSDQELQEAAARTNALISNNSWNYGIAAYDLEAASYDAAVRDALPGVTGSQPVLFVFSAGNSGNGDDSSDPGGGLADTILSPATAKNVITVGALQESRDITNQVITISASGVTNTTTPWQLETSTSSRIAGFSSRGNVGIGTEGTYGRYKPDVVAPGTFVVSTRSEQWDITDFFYINPTNHTLHTFGNIVVQPDSLYSHPFPTIHNNTVEAAIYVTPNADSSDPFPNLPIYFGLQGSPALNLFTLNNQVTIPPDGGLTIANILSTEISFGFYYAVSNSTASPISFDVTTDIVTTNNPGTYFLVLSNLDQSIGKPNPDSTGPGPYYRYESGTSMAAADVSGVLALMMDYFTNVIHAPRPSPALLKAMLINGARATSGYDFQAQNSINYEGWGLVNLPNSLPPGLVTGVSSSGSMLILDQNPTNALATGDSHTYNVTIASAAANLPLHITLAWTDPPGDPAAAIKLVNDLNLVVTNLDLPTDVYYGNDIQASSTYNTIENSTNPPVFDSINNVENVYLPKGAGTNFSITVSGYRVNVNAVTAHPNNVVQDYALVISSGNGQVTNAFTVVDNLLASNPTTGRQITYVANANAPLLNQFVGASTPLLGTNQIQLTAGSTELNGIQLGTNVLLITLGMTNQWHFYVITNNGAADFTNAAFITFIPDTLAVPRMGVFQDSVVNATRPEADIDLYVSSNPGLTNLDPVVIANADKSVGRGGTEFVYYTNSAPGKVYYIGVYSEDQEASEYGFIPIFTDIPFSQPGPNGSQIVSGLNLPVAIPDGTLKNPGNGYIFALAIYPMEVNRVVVTNAINHEHYADLIGTLGHGTANGLSKYVVLNNHDSLYNLLGYYQQIYDDSGFGDITGSRLSDGPGSLNNFIGQQAIGPWILTEADVSPTQTGTNLFFSLLIEPHQDTTKGLLAIVPPLGWIYEYIDVPAGATNLTFFATNITASGTVDFFVRLGAKPTLTNYDERVQLTPNGTISIGPPLTPGRYFIGLYNESTTIPQTVYVIASLGVGATPAQVIYSSSGPAPILDDAVITNSIFVTEDQPISSVDVALRVDHPRVSDLVFHLTSPDGTRVLLVENRGGATTNGMGATYNITNMTPITFSYIQKTLINASSSNVVDTGSTGGTLQINYNFWDVQPDEMVVYYQGTVVFDSGVIIGSSVFNIPYGPGTDTKVAIVMNPTRNPGYGDRWDYTVNVDQPYYAYLVLTENTNLTTTPIKFAPAPFNGTATIITNNVWHSSFEGGPVGDSFYNPGDYFTEGWHVDEGGVKVLTDGGAKEGTQYLDLDGTNNLTGSGPGTISTNLITSPGQTYILSFAYSPNPFAVKLQPDGLVSGVQVLQNSDLLLTLMVTNRGQAGTPTWATNSVVFTATSASTKLAFQSLNIPPVQGRGSPTNGVLLDAINLATVNVTNGDIYYQPEQSLDTFKGLSAYGEWQLEVWDNRASAYVTNLCQLVSWQLRFNFPFAVNSTILTNGTLTNFIAANSIQYYQFLVPTNADIATNLLLFATNSSGTFTPLNVWFNQSTKPSGTNSPGDFLLINGTNGASILYTTGVPPLVPGSTYWIGIQNTNAIGIDFGFRVDFHLKPASVVLTNGLPQTNSIPGGGIAYYLVNVPTNADWATNLLLFGSGPLNVWFNPTNPPVPANPPDILLFGGATTGIAIFGTNTVPTNIVPGGTYYLAVQNPGTSNVTYGIEVDFHLLLPSVAASNIVYFPVVVPTNADFATNILVFASGPLNIWFTTNSPPSITNATDVLLLPDATYPSGTNGSVVLSAGTTPPLVPGSTYWLGVQNTNSFDVFYIIEVDFHLLSVTNLGTITGPTITATNIGGNNGFLLQWQGPTNLQYEIQWTTTLAPPVWQTVLNPVINVALTATNGHFSWFDDGSLTGGFGHMKFYRVLGGLNLGTITGPGPATNTVLAGAMSQAVVTVPTNAISASNLLISATGPLNVWFNQTNPPTGNTSAGDVLMLSATTAGVFVLTGSSVPPLVPGTNYYLGFQNPGTSNVTFVFQVAFGFAPTNAMSNFSITTTNGGFLLQWQGPTNLQYEIQWTTNLAPPVWQTVLNPVINVVVTATNGHYSWFDDGSLTGGFGPMKFYRVLGSLNLGTITGPGPATNLVLAGSTSQAVVTVPTNAISASNLLISATGPLNVWFNQTNPPTGNTSAGDVLMLSATNAGVFVLTNSSVPPLVPGTNYYLGFQNPGTSNVTFVFQVAFGFAPPNAVTNFSVTATNGGLWLKWNGLTNYQYQIQWKTNLLPTVPWNTVSNIVLTSTTGLFTFFDDGSLTGGFGPMKFYRLIAWPFMTPIPQTLIISSVTVTNLAGTNDLMLKWSAPTNYQYGIQWTTNLTLPPGNWSIITNPPPALANGIYTFIDNGLTGPPASAKFFRLYEY
jgi:subtilisin-like proprotein convertase family protein